MSQKKLRVGVLGATGMVGQRFLALLEHHPWYEVTLVAASANSAGQRYADAVKGRWALKTRHPQPRRAALIVKNASDVKAIAAEVDFVFCAVDMSKEETAKLEEDYARAETPVVSNNSRPPRHARRADDGAGDQPGARPGDRAAAQAAGRPGAASSP